MPDEHKEHRKRTKRRFMKAGLDDFEPHNALELMLFYSIPLKDTNPTAHNLMNRFGTFSQVLDADPRDLCEVDGVGEASAILLKLFREVARYYAIDKQRKVKTLKTIDEIGTFLEPQFFARDREMVYLLCLDASGRMLFADVIGEGTANAVPLFVREIVEEAVRCRAASVIVAHNHPYGLAVPSNQDLASTAQLKQALALTKIRLADHLIFADGDYVSMRSSSMFESIFD